MGQFVLSTDENAESMYSQQIVGLIQLQSSPQDNLWTNHLSSKRSNQSRKGTCIIRPTLQPITENQKQPELASRKPVNQKIPDLIAQKGQFYNMKQPNQN